MARPKGGQGGKLNRSEIIQTRLNPKLRFAAELMARAERRTISSLIEKLIDEAANNYKVAWWAVDPDGAQALEMLKEKTGQDVSIKSPTVADLVHGLWKVSEPMRIVALSLLFPHLLIEEEEDLIQIIEDIPYFWVHYLINIEDQNGKVVDIALCRANELIGIVEPHLIEYWEKIKTGEVNLEELKKLSQGLIVDHPISNKSVKKIIRTDEGSKVVYVEPVPPEEKSVWENNIEPFLQEKIQVVTSSGESKTVRVLRLPSVRIEEKILRNALSQQLKENKDGN